jgi:hypothetical protein
VATIEIQNPNPVVGQELPPLRVTDAAGRVLFPVADAVRQRLPRPSERPVPNAGRGRLLGRISGLIREIAGQDQPEYLTVSRRVSFLFQGNEPIRVQLEDSRGPIGSYDIIAEQDPARHRQTLQSWWESYTAAAQSQIEAADYPVLVETYLIAMLAGRLQLPLPDWYRSASEDDELMSSLKLIAGAKATGESIFREAAAGFPGSVDASLPIPAGPRWAPPFTAEGLIDVPVEPLATRVPPDCFYIRYGSFENFLWFKDLSGEYGGQISRMVTLSGTANDSFQQVESQLNVSTTEMTRLMGPQVIEDQALIGRDLFTADGASMGVMFKARSVLLLRTSLNGERARRAREDQTVTLRTIQVADRDVSLLSSADNRVRSFMAEDGDYILITNSRTLVEKFFTVGTSGESLATTPAFQYARQLMPLERNDTIFAYFSPAMLQALVAPEYLIELRRRLHAKAELSLVHLARLAAAQENIGSAPDGLETGIDELITAGFLPRQFGSRPDGSGVISVAEQTFDALRGARGTFLPIADVQIAGVTADEAAWYQNIADAYSRDFPALDPIMAGIARESVDGVDGLERVSIHAEIAPWRPEKYGAIAQQLGPPTQIAMQFAPDDIIAMQAHVASPQLGPPTHLFAAIKDTVPPNPDDFDGLLNIYRSLRGLPGYLGAWPQPSTLDRLPLGLGQGRPVGPGMSRLIGGLYRYTDGEFSILSFQPQVIESALPFLQSVEVPDAAQVRVRIDNLNGSRLEGWVNGQLYDRARSSSLAGANFLSLLTKQLGVDPPRALDASQRVIGHRLQCSLGGEYQYSDTAGRWVSTAWNGEAPPLQAPADYQAPPMKWFRGATASLTQLPNRVVADLTVDIARGEND